MKYRQEQNGGIFWGGQKGNKNLSKDKRLFSTTTSNTTTTTISTTTTLANNVSLKTNIRWEEMNTDDFNMSVLKLRKSEIRNCHIIKQMTFSSLEKKNQ